MDDAYLASLPPRKRMALLLAANGATVPVAKACETSAPTPAVVSVPLPSAAAAAGAGAAAAGAGTVPAAGSEPPTKKPRSALTSGVPAFSKPRERPADPAAAAAAAAAKAKALAAREAAAAAAAAAAGAAKVRGARVGPSPVASAA